MENVLAKIKNLKYLSGEVLELKVYDILKDSELKFKYQPNGKQAFPDFFIEDFNLDLECKSSASAKPMWNCTYPKKDALYIFSSKKLSKTLVIRGSEIVSDEISEIYEEYASKHKLLQVEINSKLDKVSNKYNMKVFARNMFVQNTGFSAQETTLLSRETERYSRKNIGQYFTTSKTIQEKLLNDYHKNPKKILEPSSGLGHIISILPFDESRILAMDIDQDVIDISKKLFPRTTFVCTDFLEYKFDTLFDLIIGNPPYFEVNKANTPIGFSSILNGRVNVYYLFIYKCISLLEMGGELRLVLPKSFLSNIYSKKLRSYLTSKCAITGIEYFGNNEFEDAVQDVIILKCTRVERSIPSIHEFVVNDTLFFVKNKNDVPMSGKTLKSLGMTVKTGNVAWNQHKSRLKSEPGIKLWYASDISGKIDTNREKMKYLEYTDSLVLTRGPCILVQRIVSKKIKYKLIEYGEFYVENHINIISGNLEDLKLVCSSFDHELTESFVTQVFSSTQISKTELESVLQIYL